MSFSVLKNVDFRMIVSLLIAGFIVVMRNFYEACNQQHNLPASNCNCDSFRDAFKRRLTFVNLPSELSSDFRE